MPAMRSATPTISCRRRGRMRLLAWLAGGVLASAGYAQTDAGVTDEVVQPPADTGVERDAVPEQDDNAAPDLVPAAPVDPVKAGEQLLKSNVAKYGARSLQVAEAHLDLANAQRAAKDFDKAAESYLAAVEAYRSVDGAFTPLAIGPLTSLGDNYHEADDDTNAVTAYSEARTVSRRAYGLHNTEQVVLLDRMSRSLLDLNQLSEAEAQQVEALRLVQRAHPPASDEGLEAIYKYAEWLGDRLYFQLQRDQYARALRLIRQTYGEDDVRQSKPLLGIGNTYREERNPASMGISALEEALELLEAQPERDSVAMAMTLRDIGDWAVAFGKTGYSGTEYQRAWQLLGSAPNADELRRQWFTGANYVLYEPISPRGLSTDPDALSGHVTVSFDIDKAGNTQNVMLVESAPPGLKDEAVLRHIRRSRFRPVIDNGAVVVGKGLAIQVKFRYLTETAAAGGDEDAN
ncbi:MAG TPA: TonB family protein [Gammaproteobacteria bacterium]|nr:TonB family protein [Gammaproteobacteria bacterium]